jgi:hypothetical protein
MDVFWNDPIRQSSGSGHTFLSVLAGTLKKTGFRPETNQLGLSSGASLNHFSN